jgi:hypothetical protein
MGNCLSSKHTKIDVELCEVSKKNRPSPLQIPPKLPHSPDSPPRYLHMDILTPRESHYTRSSPISPQRTSKIIQLSRQLSLRNHSISKKRIKSQQPQRSASMPKKYPNINQRSPKSSPPILKPRLI